MAPNQVQVPSVTRHQGSRSASVAATRQTKPIIQKTRIDKKNSRNYKVFFDFNRQLTEISIISFKEKNKFVPKMCFFCQKYIFFSQIWLSECN